MAAISSKMHNKAIVRISKDHHALAANAMVPWDIPIRSNHGLDGSALSCRSFLITVRIHLVELKDECENYG